MSGFLELKGAYLSGAAPLTRRKEDLAPGDDRQPNLAAVKKWWSLSDAHHRFPTSVFRPGGSKGSRWGADS